MDVNELADALEFTEHSIKTWDGRDWCERCDWFISIAPSVCTHEITRHQAAQLLRDQAEELARASAIVNDFVRVVEKQSATVRDQAKRIEAMEECVEMLREVSGPRGKGSRSVQTINLLSRTALARLDNLTNPKETKDEA